MSATATYQYLRPSALADRDLTLQTSGGPAAHPRFFTGFLTAPTAAAAGLLAVAEVARTRYHRPVDPASLDPVVTGSRDRLRFESFSGCCGVYARLDVTPDGLDGDIVAHGTTNVDVNPPLREALARVGGLDPLHLSVGPDDVTVSTMDGQVVERKVPLPRRWLRGFAEVQVVAAAMGLRAEIPVAEAATFLQRLPGAADRSVLWAVPAGRSLRLTSRAAPGAGCLAGAGRLVALRGLLRHAVALRVYGPAVAAGAAPVASVWELDLGGMSLSLALSPDPTRGFSGEGGVLRDLASDDVTDDAELVGALLDWEPTVDVDALADAAGITARRVRAALTLLGTAGRVGYDVARAGYFHRVLPYDPGRTERDNPRLAGARALVETGAVTVDDAGATVHHGDEVYRVRRLPEGGHTCTCVWWARHRGGRGPCKHVLATTMVTAPVEATA
ncbi:MULTISPECIES: SWIM zinc finger family protein [unclassified Solwaraspora]|uniref:SWIM zinc finger family protein n=1 Tax=unclassified Solwaraspora TaxID=2627926 RepID=UPI00259B4EF4|nr:SWIM zinc finger family protein [Solwaraspora sp. WMMA2056]WJK39259.1 SWIM zinc finger family protein [Solwaraspora sp. WMMA2056]